MICHLQVGISESMHACSRNTQIIHTFNPDNQPVSALEKLDGQLREGGAGTVWAQNTHLECKHSATLTRNEGGGKAENPHGVGDGETDVREKQDPDDRRIKAECTLGTDGGRWMDPSWHLRVPRGRLSGI